MVYVCLDTCCSHFLIIAGVDLHFRHESELPVCRHRGLNPGRRSARRDVWVVVQMSCVLSLAGCSYVKYMKLLFICNMWSEILSSCFSATG